MIRQLVLLVFLVLANTYTETDGVLVLTQDEFAGAVKDHSFLFIKFYTPWCGHCKKLAPIFIELAAQLRNILPNIRLAEIDLDESKSLQAKLKIQSFPTLMLFKNGVPITFGGSRTKEFMTQWLSKKIQEPIVLIDSAKLATLQTDGNVNIVFFGDIHSTQGNALVNIAKNDDYNMYYRVEGTSRKAGSVQIYRPFGPALRYDNVDYNIRSWINLYDRPIVYEYNDRTTTQFFTEKRNGILLLQSQGDEGTAIIKAFAEAAQQWKIKQKKRLIFTQIPIADEAHSGISSYIKVNPAIHPIIYIKNAEKQKFLLNAKLSQITSAKIIDFIKNVESGKVRKYKLDDETRPKQAQTTSEL